MEKNETILLDARLKAVLDNHAFSAELANGHRFTAFLVRRDAERARLRVGDRVQVEMSPFDMSKGRIVLREKDDESKSVSQTDV